MRYIFKQMSYNNILLKYYILEDYMIIYGNIFSIYDFMAIILDYLYN